MTTAPSHTQVGLASSPPAAHELSEEQNAELQAKVEKKEKVVQNIIGNIETALKNNRDKDRVWLQKILNPGDECFRTLVRLVIEPKYRDFSRLRRLALKAIQMLLRVARLMVPEERNDDPNVGAALFEELAGAELTGKAFPQIVDAVKSRDTPLLSCDALCVLAELGPNAYDAEVLTRTLELFVALPDRADELVEVVLRMHAAGGSLREDLQRSILVHPGGKLLCEVLLQVVNRGDDERRLRGVKVLLGAIKAEVADANAEAGAEPPLGKLLYTNDVTVLVEILLRDIPNSAGNAAEFFCYSELLKALHACCPAARTHRIREVVDMLEDVRDDERNPAAVRAACSEVLAAIA